MDPQSTTASRSTEGRSLPLSMDVKALNQCDSCSRFSHSGLPSSTGLSIGLYILTAGAVLLTVCGNLLVIISICCFKHLHTPTNLILLSLAIADLLIGITVMPFHFALLIESVWQFGTVICSLFLVCSRSLPCVSFYNMAFIAVDRYFALHNPFQYATKITVSVSLLVICLIWIFSLFYHLCFLYFSGSFESINPGRAYSVVCRIVYAEISGTIDCVCIFIVPCSIIIILYSRVFVIARKHIRAISKHHTRDIEVHHSVASERKAAKNLGILVIGFLLCTIPCNISIFVQFKIPQESVFNVFKCFLSLLFLNSTINPVIYALFYTWFQKCVKHILTFKLCRSQPLSSGH